MKSICMKCGVSGIAGTKCKYCSNIIPEFKLLSPDINDIIITKHDEDKSENIIEDIAGDIAEDVIDDIKDDIKDAIEDAIEDAVEEKNRRN